MNNFGKILKYSVGFLFLMTQKFRKIYKLIDLREYSDSNNILLNWSSLTFEEMLQMLRHLIPDTHLL